jgi:hypothetical protein
MDLNKLIELLENKPEPGSSDEEVRHFAELVKDAMTLRPKSSVSFGSYEEDLKKMRGDADCDPEEPNKNGDIYKKCATEPRQSAFMKLLSDRNTGKIQGGHILAAPVRPQQWTGHKPSFEREHEMEQFPEHFRDVVFGPYPADKSEETVEQLRHLLTQALANRAQADEKPCKKPCRFLKESIRDSEVSGVPVGVRQRCAHPVFEQKAMYSLLSVYAQILDSTEKFCEALVKANPEVLDALPTARKIQLATSQSLLITPRENNKDLIIGYLTDLDFMRSKVAAIIDEMKETHALTVSDDKYFTHEEHSADKERNS